MEITEYQLMTGVQIKYVYSSGSTQFTALAANWMFLVSTLVRRTEEGFATICADRSS